MGVTMAGSKGSRNQVARRHTHSGDAAIGERAGEKTAASTGIGEDHTQKFNRTDSFRQMQDDLEKRSEEDLEFQKRQPPKQDFPVKEFWGYALFLVLFLHVATNQRNSDVYNFAKSSREIVGAQFFESIGHSADYFEYLGVHFFPGLQEISVDRPAAAPFSLVGAPRIRAVRAKRCEVDDNGMSDYLNNVAHGMLCLHPVDSVGQSPQDDYETESYGGQDGKFFKHWIHTKGREHPDGLDGNAHNSFGWEAGVWWQNRYPGTGYLVPSDIIAQLLVAPTNVSVHGSEFYPFPHEAIDVSVLEENGWWDPQVVAIMHDLTIVSVNKEMYCHVRLLLEVGANHGRIKPTVQTSIVFLDDVASGKVAAEALFMLYIFVMVFSELSEFWELYTQSGNKELHEQMVEHRYELRQRMLQYAAFQGIMVYNPHPVMKKLMNRLFVKYQDEGQINTNRPSPTHIDNLNRIGEEMVRVHDKWRTMRETGFKPRDETGKLYYMEWDDEKESESGTKGASIPAAMKVGDAQARQAAMAVIDLFDRVRTIHSLRLKEKEMGDQKGATGILAWNQIKARFPTAAMLYFRNFWNFLDFLNYMLFLTSIYYRSGALLNEIPSIQAQLDALTEESRYSTFVDFSVFAKRDGVQNSINAFNAVLTWLKIFKYLEVKPQYKMLTNTLKKSATMLSSLTMSFFLVLVGSGQGFFMAFGAHVYSFRSFQESILGLLRMAVGDFDYSELPHAQPVLGPLLFWIYILLVFFVLMSMFIALIGEAFEEAKDEHAANKAKLHVSGGKLKFLSTRRLLQEARTRRDLASKTFYPEDSDEAERGMGLVSDGFIRQLKPFDRALNAFMGELQRQEAISERKSKKTRRSQRQRRASVQLEHEPTTSSAVGAVCTACWNRDLQSWWDSSLMGQWMRSRLYWSQVEQKDKTGQVKHVAQWYHEKEMKVIGMQYKATDNYTQRATTELSYEAGNVIIITKKERDKVDENGNVLKEGVWKGFRQKDGPGNNRVVRNHRLLKEIPIENFDQDQHRPVDLGDIGAESEADSEGSGYESEDALEDTIQLADAGGAESSSDDEDIALALTKHNKRSGARGRVQTMFGNPAQAHTYGVDPDIPESDRNDEHARELGGAAKGSGPAPLPLALLTSTTGSTRSRFQDDTVEQLNRKIERLELELRKTREALDARELEIEQLRSSSGDRDISWGVGRSAGGGGGTRENTEDSRMISEIHEMLSAKQKFEDKTWTARGGMARAILEDHDKTKKIETTLRTVVRKLESIEAASAAGVSALPGAAVEQWGSIEEVGGGGASRGNFVETPSTRLRRVEHQEDAAIEWQRRRQALQTR